MAFRSKGKTNLGKPWVFIAYFSYRSRVYFTYAAVPLVLKGGWGAFSSLLSLFTTKNFYRVPNKRGTPEISWRGLAFSNQIPDPELINTLLPIQLFKKNIN